MFEQDPAQAHDILAFEYFLNSRITGDTDNQIVGYSLYPLLAAESLCHLGALEWLRASVGIVLLIRINRQFTGNRIANRTRVCGNILNGKSKDK